MRNDVFSRSPFGRKAYAHGLHFDPALDRSPLEPPLPPDSPILARWSAVRNCLPPLAELLDERRLLRRRDRHAPGRRLQDARGHRAHVQPAERAEHDGPVAGRGCGLPCCPGRGACTDMANFTGPVPEGGNVAVVAQIVAFTDDRRMELLMKAEKASRSAGCPGSRGRVRAGWKPCRSTLRQPFPRHHRGKRSDAPPQGFHPESGGTRKGKRRRRANRASALPRSAAAWDSLGCSPESGVTRMGEPIRGWRETPGRPEWR